MIKVTDGIESEQQKILILMIEYTQWKNGIMDYLARHNKRDMWKWYKKVIPTIPYYLQLMLFMEVIYTKQDKISRKQYSYFKRLCTNEPEKSIQIRNHLISNDEYRFPDEYITIYRGEHGLSNTYIGCDHTTSKNVEHGISWTYEKSVAGFFAVRTQSSDCKIYTAKIHKSDVLLIYDERYEAEVIIKPICIGTNLIDLKEEQIKANISVMKEFYKYRDAEKEKYSIDEEYFLDIV